MIRCVPSAKRFFDVTSSFLGLLGLVPVFLAVALLIKATSRGPVFFRQRRVGCGFRPFVIYKFRTMVADAPKLGEQITVAQDPRITWIGRILRRMKIDELPQLINVLRGDMSLVGPRPEVPHYVEMFRADYEEILQVRPGITDLASIEYRDEEAVLAKARDSGDAYVQIILPKKIKLAKEYIRRASFSFDLYLIVLTILKIGTDRFTRKRIRAVDDPDVES